MRDELKINNVVVCIVGLGYVGLPLARAFAEHCTVIGFDIDKHKISCLSKQSTGSDRSNSGDSTLSTRLPSKLTLTSDPRQMSQAEFIIICVPTPVNKSKRPDLSYIKNAAKTVGQNMKRNSIIILESTVYPGVTEEIVEPILEKESNLKCGKDFKIAYSPERINPGDKKHTIDKITKVVSGIDEQTIKAVSELYQKIAPRIFVAKDIRTAEAAKVIENIQRDLNIALVNELSIIFGKMGLNTKDVLDAAKTKWNFHSYAPGLVGGHCIPVDPYYLVHRANQLGYHPRVILAGRATNNYMPKHIVDMAIRALEDAKKVTEGSKVLIMGLTYKENVTDTRETPIKELVDGLKHHGIRIFGYDPGVNNIEDRFEIDSIHDLGDVRDIDCTIIAVAHDVFKDISLDEMRRFMSDTSIMIDIKRIFDEEKAKERGFIYLSL